MSSYRTPFGLPVRYEFESDLHIENEFLFGLYEMLVSSSHKLRVALQMYYFRVIDLNYPNHVHLSVNEKEISHDQLTAYVCYSMIYNTEDTLKIWKQINMLRFRDRFLHPRDYIFYGMCAGNLGCLFLSPILVLICAVSMAMSYRIVKDEVDRPDQVYRLGKFIIRSKLSGELLWWLRCESVKSSKLLTMLLSPCRIIVELGARLRFGGISNMVKRYFNDDENHPIVRHLNDR